MIYTRPDTRTNTLQQRVIYFRVGGVFLGGIQPSDDGDDNATTAASETVAIVAAARWDD